jgi:hypothetical protein
LQRVVETSGPRAQKRRGPSKDSCVLNRGGPRAGPGNSSRVADSNDDDDSDADVAEANRSRKRLAVEAPGQPAPRRLTRTGSGAGGGGSGSDDAGAGGGGGGAAADDGGGKGCDGGGGGSGEPVIQVAPRSPSAALATARLACAYPGSAHVGADAAVPASTTVSPTGGGSGHCDDGGSGRGGHSGDWSSDGRSGRGGGSAPVIAGGGDGSGGGGPRALADSREPTAIMPSSSLSRCKVEEFALAHGMSPADVRFLADNDALLSNKVHGAYNNFAGCLVDRSQPPINASLLVALDDLPTGVSTAHVRSAGATLRRVAHGGKEVRACVFRGG